MAGNYWSELRGQDLTTSESPDYARNLASLTSEEIEAQRNLMVSVATGGPRINEVDDDYKRRRKSILTSLERLKLSDPNPYQSLWDWYAKWSSGDLPTYASRRQFLRDMFEPVFSALKGLEAGIRSAIVREPTGWFRVDRAIDKMRTQFAAAEDEEDFQQVGLLGREILISLGQAVYDPSRHLSTDGVSPSATDANRMLGAYIATEVAGGENKQLRRYAKAALDLALELQHERKADHRKAGLCTEATSSVVNIIAIISGRHDPIET